MVQAYSRPPSRVWYMMFAALAKFWARKWLVPAWRALRSCVIASMQRVFCAPGKRSPAVFSPVSTGTAMYSSLKVLYTSSICRVSSHASASVS